MPSRWLHRLPLVAASSRSTSPSVRYSRVRRSILGRRRGVIVRFSAVGVIIRRWDLAKVFILFGGCCSDDGHFPNSITLGGSRPQSASNEIDPPGVHGQAGVSRAPRHGPKKCSSTFRSVNQFLSQWRSYRDGRLVLPILPANRTSAANSKTTRTRHEPRAVVSSTLALNAIHDGEC